MKVMFQPFAYKRLGEIVAHLSGYPRLGAIEPLINNPDHEYRRLIEGHNKIIYWIGDHDVRIADIFDSRRDPTEMLG